MKTSINIQNATREKLKRELKPLEPSPPAPVTCFIRAGKTQERIETNRRYAGHGSRPPEELNRELKQNVGTASKVVVYGKDEELKRVERLEPCSTASGLRPWISSENLKESKDVAQVRLAGLRAGSHAGILDSGSGIRALAPEGSVKCN